MAISPSSPPFTFVIVFVITLPQSHRFPDKDVHCCQCRSMLCCSPSALKLPGCVQPRQHAAPVPPLPAAGLRPCSMDAWTCGIWVLQCHLRCAYTGHLMVYLPRPSQACPAACVRCVAFVMLLWHVACWQCWVAGDALSVRDAALLYYYRASRRQMFWRRLRLLQAKRVNRGIMEGHI